MKQIGFIGTGVMGEPMCRHLAAKSGLKVLALDRDPAPLARLAAHGAVRGDSVAGVFEGSDVVFLSLPSGEIVRELALQPQGMMSAVQPGQIVVDLSTSPVDITRELAGAFAEMGATFIDSPVARTRAAAEAGQLFTMVGGDAAVVDKVKPLLATFASDIIHCGAVGCGQIVKILNNMVLFETCVALAEAKAIGERSGMNPALLFEALSKGSADSFALRSHGMKAMLTGDFPERAFSVEYARKDLAYALRLAEQTGVDARGARLVEDWYAEAVQAGLGPRYHPVIGKLIGG
jgi:3-hydroxyisobutyrate dehydrogenase-like beta-hydroxyacid dehydrogenase